MTLLIRLSLASGIFFLGMSRAESLKVQERVQQAKALMSQGHRIDAIQLLNNGIEQSRADAKAKKTRSQLKSIDNGIRELSSKRSLFSEQFLSAQAFQQYEEAKSLAQLERWDECIHELESVGLSDQDNLLVMKLRAHALLRLKKYEAALKVFQLIAPLVPNDCPTGLGLAEIAFDQKRTAAGLAALEPLSPQTSADIERYAILKARLLEQAGKPSEAVEVLQRDQDAHLDHNEVLYELGTLHSRIPGHDWPARKTLSLFLTRCKRMKEDEMKARHFDALCVKAQTLLTDLDKKLGVY